MTDRLRKSCRVYRSMLARMPMDQRSPEYRAALDYIRKLYAEHGRANVRRALGELRT